MPAKPYSNFSPPRVYTYTLYTPPDGPMNKITEGPTPMTDAPQTPVAQPTAGALGELPPGDLTSTVTA